jgi:hypothetical protein
MVKSVDKEEVGEFACESCSCHSED